MHNFIENEEEPYKYKWVDSSVSVFLVVYMNNFFLIENDISYIIENKGFAVIIALHKRLGKSIHHPRDEDL